MSEKRGRRLAADLSVSALLYQAQILVSRLEAIGDDEYLPPTTTLARLLALLARQACDQLSVLDQKPLGTLSKADELLARQIGSVVHVLHSFLRYLQASDPLHTPPGIQKAIGLLIGMHGPSALGCDRNEISVLVRPQWTYNLKYVDILPHLEAEADVDVPYALDPPNAFGAQDTRELLAALCAKMNAILPEADKLTLPKHSAVISFAALDNDDVLLYPLLAHELGHFIDFGLQDAGKECADVVADRFLPSRKLLKAQSVISDSEQAIKEMIRFCLREITADLLAARMLGLGYFFAFSEFFKTLVTQDSVLVDPKTGYPSFAVRLAVIWQEITETSGGMCQLADLQAILRRWRLPGASTLRGYLTECAKGLSGATRPKSSTIVERSVLAALPSLRRLARRLIPTARAAKVPADVEQMVELIADRIPPFQAATRAERQKYSYKSWSFDEIVTAGWLYQIAIGEDRERGYRQPTDRFHEYRNTCLLLLKALELEGSGEAFRKMEDRARGPKPGLDPTHRGMSRRGVISGPALRAALDRTGTNQRLTLLPDFGDSPIESASRDLHLGHWFRVFKRTSVTAVDIASAEDRRRARRLGQSEVFVGVGGQFVLQPGDFALAASLEYVGLPADMMAFVEGKSSLGRAGLLIATATQIAPGFKGCVVLELFNAGTVPVILRPGMRVAQLVLVATDSPVPPGWLYAGEFQVQVRP